MHSVFDKLDAPQVDFIDQNRIRKWFGASDFTDIHISWYKGVSCRASAVKK